MPESLRSLDRVPGERERAFHAGRESEPSDDVGVRLFGERWSPRNGHLFSYIGLCIFTIVLFYRPYELSTSLAWLNAAALPIAIGTLAVYLPTQFYLENRLSIWTTEVKCVLGLTLLAIITMPIATDRAMAYDELRNSLGKVAIVFLILVNAVRNRNRWTIMFWLLLGAGLMLSYQAVELYRKGEFLTEGYRVSLKTGMIGNPNDMSMFFLLLVPIAIGLGLVTRSTVGRVMYFAAAALMSVSILLTQSRGGFLGIIAVTAVFVWKFGRANRFKVVLISSVLLGALLAFAPGNYGIRVLSIFVPSLDPVGSSTGRSELLKTSIWVTLRNPQGIGIGNSSLFGHGNHVTHNAYTQVSSELGLIGLGLYLAILISPLRKLGTIERLSHDKKERRWYYVTAVSLQASIASYMVTSFFGSVAYQWYIYYPIVFSIVLRRMFVLENENEADLKLLEPAPIGSK